MQWKILQGGYQSCKDTMLGNMISNEGMRENSKIISIDDKSEYYNDKRGTNESTL
jgi:Tfp pilus assembly ATPase PilU